MLHYLLLLPGTSRHSPKWGWTTQKKTITFAYVAQALDNMQIQLLFTKVIVSAAKMGSAVFKSPPHYHKDHWLHTVGTSRGLEAFRKKLQLLHVLQKETSRFSRSRKVGLYPSRFCPCTIPEKSGGRRHLVLAKSVRYHHSMQRYSMGAKTQKHTRISMHFSRLWLNCASKGALSRPSRGGFHAIGPIEHWQQPYWSSGLILLRVFHQH